MSSFALVGLASTYREGPLARTAVASLLAAGLDSVIVWEGPAGRERLDEAPATDLGGLHEHVDYRESETGWSSDAIKRSEMLHYSVRVARKQTGEPRLPVWAVWLDGDEQLVNGWALRDLVQERVWHDESTGASMLMPANLPTGGIPLRLVEYDGSCSFAKGRLIRLDTLRRFVVSNLIVETVHGVQLRLGNAPEYTDLEDLILRMKLGYEPTKAELEQLPVNVETLRTLVDRRLVAPPLPGEAVIVHRSHLRHPARKLSRMHAQEAAELERMGLPG